MKYILRTDRPYEITLCENDRTKSILQNLSLLFATRKGTIPMYRDFGLSQTFVDKPQAVAQALALADVTDAVEQYEPRANVVSARTVCDGANGKTAIIVEVDI